MVTMDQLRDLLGADSIEYHRKGSGVDKVALEQRIEALQRMQAAHMQAAEESKAKANGCAGAIEDCRYWLSQLPADDKEPTKAKKADK